MTTSTTGRCRDRSFARLLSLISITLYLRRQSEITVQSLIRLQGHRIVLPEDIGVAEDLPLVVIGAGKALLLRNVTIVQAASLTSCLKLGAGAQLIARPEDNVSRVEGADPDLIQEMGGEVHPHVIPFWNDCRTMLMEFSRVESGA